jgi:hypothetical protein
MRTAFAQPSEAFWHATFTNSQRGGGGGINPFIGYRYQRGSGFGNVLKSLFRFILPVAKSAGKAVGLQALETGGQLASDIAEGKDIQSSLKRRGRTAASKLVTKAAKRIVRKIQTGKGRKTQTGTGFGIRGRNKPPIKRRLLKRKTFRKRKRGRKTDALEF